ncbi:MAG: hypothetical protein WA840_20570 [Caulobacteraceae bacterium]
MTNPTPTEAAPDVVYESAIHVLALGMPELWEGAREVLARKIALRVKLSSPASPTLAAAAEQAVEALRGISLRARGFVNNDAMQSLASRAEISAEALAAALQQAKGQSDG